MADIIGILGLALAVFDELLTIGERTADIIKEIRAYDTVRLRLASKSIILTSQDVGELEQNLSNELWKTRTMRGLLVTRNSVRQSYKGCFQVNTHNRLPRPLLAGR